jgi:hypothetical protein
MSRNFVASKPCAPAQGGCSRKHKDDGPGIKLKSTNLNEETHRDSDRFDNMRSKLRTEFDLTRCKQFGLGAIQSQRRDSSWPASGTGLHEERDNYFTNRPEEKRAMKAFACRERKLFVEAGSPLCS